MENTTNLSVRFKEYWDGFKPGEWQEGINTRDFIMTNFTPYSGGPEFLCGPTERTKALNAKLGELFKKSVKTAVYWILTLRWYHRFVTILRRILTRKTSLSLAIRRTLRFAEV